MFPVQRLFPNITADFRKYSNVNIPDALLHGLKNEITIVDQDSSISTYADIRAFKNDKGEFGSYEVTLSAAFSQYVYIMCDVLLRSADYFTMVESSKDCGGIEVLIKENDKHLLMTDEELLSLYPDFLSSLQKNRKF